MPKLHGSNWFLGWRIQTQCVDHCPFHEPLWMSHAGELGTKCVSKAAKANENWPWTRIHQRNGDRHGKRAKSDTRWFPVGNRQFYEETHAHRGTAVTIWNTTHWTYDTVAPNYRHLHLGVISHHWLLFQLLLFLSVSLFYLPVISSSLKFLLLLLVSPPFPLPTSALKGSLQLEEKQTQQWIFNWIVRSWLF